jgi:MraZ protein
VTTGFVVTLPDGRLSQLVMPLTGTFERTMDDKLRLAVPKPLRDGFPEADATEFYLAPGNEGCLSLYSTSGFEQLASRLATISPGRANVRNFLRFFYSQAERVVVDKQSRIRLPDRLVNLAGLTHDVVLIGVQDHVEIWDKGRWDSFLSQNGPQFDELTAQALDMQMFGQ